LEASWVQPARTKAISPHLQNLGGNLESRPLKVTVQSPVHESPLPLGKRARERGQIGWGTERLPLKVVFGRTRMLLEIWGIPLPGLTGCRPRS